ncbi:hypothetical protein ALC60_02405, partial [Trachymyrmex zeteki]
GHVALPPPHRYCTTTDATWTKKGSVIPLIKTRINNHRLGNNPFSTRENPSNTIESDGDIESCTDAEKYLHSPHNALGRITSTK